MSNMPTETDEERRREPSPSLRGVYQDPDGTHETGNSNSEEETQNAPASTMNSGVDPFRRDDLLEPAAQHPDQPVPNTPQARESDQLAENPIQPEEVPKD